MSDTRITIEGVEFVSPDACSFGDYGGSGSTGLANIRAICSDAGESVYETWFSTISHSEDGDAYRVWKGDKDVEELRTFVRDGGLVLHPIGDWLSESVYIRADSDLARETLERLESYPALDDDASSDIEMEWLDEAWNDWLKTDLIKEAFKADEDEWERVEAMPDSDLRQAFHAAMEACNEYPEAEYSSVFVRVERIAESFAAHVRAIVTE